MKAARADCRRETEARTDDPRGGSKLSISLLVVFFFSHSPGLVISKYVTDFKLLLESTFISCRVSWRLAQLCDRVVIGI